MIIERKAPLLVFAAVIFYVSFFAAAQSIKLDFTTDKDVYNIGDTVKIWGNTNAKSVTISITGISPLDALKVVNVDNGEFNYDYHILPGDYGKVVVRVGDNNSTEKEKFILIGNDSNDSSLAVDFITPANNERFFRNNNMTIKVRVTENGTPSNDAKVFCKLIFPGPPEADTTMALVPVGDFFSDVYQITGDDIKNGGVYYTNYQIGRGDLTRFWVLKCIAQKSGTLAGSSRSIKVVNEPILIDFLLPQATVVQSGVKSDVMIRVYYQDGSPVVNSFVQLEDSEGRSSEMKAISNSGLYEFKNYDITSNNNYMALTAIANDDVGNAGKQSIILRVVKNNLLEMIYKLWWIIPTIMLIVLFTMYLEKQMELSYADKMSKPRKTRSALAELEEERNNIIEAKSSIEKNYYQRKLDENEFRRMNGDFSRKLIEIEIKIKSLKRELKESE